MNHFAKSGVNAATAIISRGPSSKTWSVGAQSMPGYTRTNKADNKVYQFIQSFSIGNVLTTSVTVPVNGAVGFTANGAVNQFASFAAIFDQYRIDQIEAWLVPTSATSNEQNFGFLYSSVDYDDATASTPSLLLQKSNVVVSPLSLGHYHKFKPHVAIAAYSGAFTSFANMSRSWLDCGSPGIVHYGLKFSSDITTIVYNVELMLRVTISFRNVT